MNSITYISTFQCIIFCVFFASNFCLQIKKYSNYNTSTFKKNIKSTWKIKKKKHYFFWKDSRDWREGGTTHRLVGLIQEAIFHYVGLEIVCCWNHNMNRQLIYKQSDIYISFKRLGANLDFHWKNSFKGNKCQSTTLYDRVGVGSCVWRTEGPTCEMPLKWQNYIFILQLQVLYSNSYMLLLFFKILNI